MRWGLWALAVTGRCGATLAAARTTNRASAKHSDWDIAASSLAKVDLRSLLADMSSKGKKKTRPRSTA